MTEVVQKVSSAFADSQSAV